jgi:hypothetical protein
MRRGNRRIAGLALLASIALAIGVLEGPAASASGGGVATTSSLKKCLKKAKKKSTHKKRKKAKKRCHKKYKHGAGTSSLVRATLTWDSSPPGGGGNIDLDLWVFDSSGNKARAAADTIPNSNFSTNDVDAPGSETFTDLAYKKPGGRDFSFGVCYQDGGSQQTDYQLDYVTADGAHHNVSGHYGSDGISTDYNGGAPIPSNYCKAP